MERKSWGVYNENGLIEGFYTEEEAEIFMDKKNFTWQTCGFYVKQISEEQ